MLRSLALAVLLVGCTESHADTSAPVDTCQQQCKAACTHAVLGIKWVDGHKFSEDAAALACQAASSDCYKACLHLWVEAKGSK